MTSRSDPTAIRNAATVIVLRQAGPGVSVLMGQRGRNAAFMPDKFVFPGGALDATDLAVKAVGLTDKQSVERLAIRSDPDVARALPVAAVRELWEETGLRLGAADPDAPNLDVPDTWADFFAAGYVPSAAALKFVFRAITPPGRSRRFDARFFTVDAAELIDPADDLTSMDGELRHLQWISLKEARNLPLPFITEVVLTEIEASLETPDPNRPVPFMNHDVDGSHFHLL